MKGEPLRSTAGRSIQSLTTSEQDLSEPAADSTKATTDTAPSAVVETAPPAEERTPDTPPAAPRPPAGTETSSTPPRKPVPQKSTATVKPTVASKTPSPAKPAADKIATPSAPVEPQPSLPVSMIVRPDSAAASDSSLFPGELEESFDSALARVEPMRARNSLAARISGGIRKLLPSRAGGQREPANIQRMVAFDGFRDDLFEDKCERDRRYGTVYTVLEAVNAYLVRLELPRRMPNSSLKQTWKLPDEMPDYACTLSLTDNVLCIRAGLPDEARRRLSYVSSSFPSDFQTRIEFQLPVEGYKHRLRNKVLEVIVYKKRAFSSARNLS